MSDTWRKKQLIFVINHKRDIHTASQVERDLKKKKRFLTRSEEESPAVVAIFRTL